MKFYNYLLFRLYTFFAKAKMTDGDVHYFISVISTFIVVITIQTCFYFYEYYFTGLTHRGDVTKSVYTLFFLIIGFINYFFFIRKNKFLNYQFKEDKKGGVLIIIFIFFLFSSLMFIIEKNRNKIIEEKEKLRIEKTNIR